MLFCGEPKDYNTAIALVPLKMALGLRQLEVVGEHVGLVADDLDGVREMLSDLDIRC
jgi:hypothetical protein